MIGSCLVCFDEGVDVVQFCEQQCRNCLLCADCFKKLEGSPCPQCRSVKMSQLDWYCYVLCTIQVCVTLVHIIQERIWCRGDKKCVSSVTIICLIISTTTLYLQLCYFAYLVTWDMFVLKKIPRKDLVVYQDRLLVTGSLSLSLLFMFPSSS